MLSWFPNAWRTVLLWNQYYVFWFPQAQSNNSHFAKLSLLTGVLEVLVYHWRSSHGIGSTNPQLWLLRFMGFPNRRCPGCSEGVDITDPPTGYWPGALPFAQETLYLTMESNDNAYSWTRFIAGFTETCPNWGLKLMQYGWWFGCPSCGIGPICFFYQLGLDIPNLALMLAPRIHPNIFWQLGLGYTRYPFKLFGGVCLKRSGENRVNAAEKHNSI